jgi:D-alanyl-D-alanine carboxypeptidase
MRGAGILIIGMLALASLAAHGASAIPVAKLDAYFDTLEKQGLVNGSIAISELGVVRYRRSVGFATIDNGIPQPADAGTRYHIGSVTKLFTAALVVQLAEQASITLDSKLAEFYPDLPNALGISYRDLLQHRSGLANYRDTRDFDSWRTTARSHADLLKVINDGGAKFQPGERLEYNDSNYLLLGYVVEKVYERSYDEVVRQRVASKLGLARTYYAGTGIARTLESTSYQWTPQGWRPEVDTDPSIDGGSGGMVSNAGDLATFMDALFAGKLVTAHSLESMLDQTGGSGIGLWPVQIAGVTGFGERGAEESYRACVYHFPDRKISLAWTSNASRISMDEILEEVVRLIYRTGRKPPALTPAG